MSKKTKKSDWVRRCPNCHTELYYSTKSALKLANNNNSLCRPCSLSGKNNPMYGKSHKNESIQKMRDIKIGKKQSEETVLKRLSSEFYKTDEYRNKMSISLSGKNNPMYGKKHKSDSIQKMRVSRISEIESKFGTVIPNYNPSSIPIIEEKARELSITDLQHAENGGEYHIKELGYFVDGYSKEKNIVIEYYELHHKRQLESDNLRKNEIIEHLGCEFIIIEEQKK